MRQTPRPLSIFCLSDGYTGSDERPVTTHCTRVLPRALDWEPITPKNDLHFVVVLPDTGEDRDGCWEIGQRGSWYRRRHIINGSRATRSGAQLVQIITTLLIPDALSRDRTATSKDLDGKTLAYFRDLFGALCKTVLPHKPASKKAREARMPSVYVSDLPPSAGHMTGQT